MTRVPPRFLIGQHPERGELWAAIDAHARFLKPAVADRRFGAYLKPFFDERAAKDALVAAGAVSVEEERGRGQRRGGR